MNKSIEKKGKNMVPVIGQGISVVEEDGVILLKDRLLYSYVELNDTSVYLLELMKEDKSFSEIIECMKEEYQLDDKTALYHDLEQFYQIMKKRMVVHNRRSLGFKINQWYCRLYKHLYPKDQWF